MQNMSFKGLRRVMPGEHNIHLVFWCLLGRELTTLGHESAALTTRPWLLAVFIASAHSLMCSFFRISVLISTFFTYSHLKYYIFQFKFLHVYILNIKYLLFFTFFTFFSSFPKPTTIPLQGRCR